MSQPDFHEQEPLEEKPSKAKEAGKTAGKALIRKAAGRGGAKALMNPYVLTGVGILLFIGVIFLAMFAFVLFFASSSQDQQQPFGFWGGSISEIGENEIPANFIPIYEEAASEYDVPWNLLAAVHRVETRFSTLENMESPVGAIGHAQFMDCTWVGWSYPSCNGLGDGDIPKSTLTDPEKIQQYGGYGVDANGDGKADPWDIDDAIHSAANYLEANGAADGNIQEAVFSYNQADWYVEDVLAFADSYVDGYTTIELENIPEGKVGELVQVGTQWIGNSEYVWGGGRNKSDQAAGRFDCSSYVHWAFEQVGVELGPLSSVTTDTLKHMGENVPPDQMKPGDLVFFDTYKRDGHVGIYAGNGKFIGAQTSTGVAFENMETGYWSEVFNGRVQRIS